MNSNKNNKFNSTCVYYDKDLKSLSKCFEVMSGIFSDIESRFARKDTLEISTSVFNYMEKQVLKCKDPHPFYRFCLDEVEIFIFCPRKGLYNIKITGLDKSELPDYGFIPYLDYDKCWILPQSHSDLGVCETQFREVVESYLLKVKFGYGLF